MTLHQFLNDRAQEIVAEATDVIVSGHLQRFKTTDRDHIHQRLRALTVLTIRAVKERNLGPMIAHADAIARGRFTTGGNLQEIQTVFNVLEEILWTRILQELPPADYAEALGLVSTVLGTGKDTAAGRFVSLSGKSRVQTLNLASLFTGAGP